eukprot:5347975-Prymnesium_polylepis.1
MTCQYARFLGALTRGDAAGLLNDIHPPHKPPHAPKRQPIHSAAPAEAPCLTPAPFSSLRRPASAAHSPQSASSNGAPFSSRPV